jgi:hypothetical protein
MAEAGRWPKPADARCTCPVRGHRARDRHGGTTAGAGNDDEVGCGCGGEHRRAKDSTLGKVVGGGTHRGDTTLWRGYFILERRCSAEENASGGRQWLRQAPMAPTRCEGDESREGF